MDLHLKSLSKHYADVSALNAVDLDISSGELVALLGPSGSGKTTLLRVIAGLLHPDEGRVLFGDNDATQLSLRERNVGFVFQHYALFRHMMLLSELARREGLFEFLAAHAVHVANGSPRRLFLLAYAIGTVVTVFMSNDATAVVLTPAVYAAARQARAPPLPFLFACAFIANAASFVLPISNPANLVIFGSHLPPLTQWLSLFALPSVLAVVATYATHRVLQRGALRGRIASEISIPALSRAGATTGYGIVVVAVALLVASFLGVPLGWPTLVVTGLVAAIVHVGKREAPTAVLRHVSWGVLPLVAALFVLVEGLQYTGVVERLVDMTGPRSEPPMPMLTMLRMRLPVAPVQRPSRTLSENADMRSSTAWTSGTTSTPSTSSRVPGGARSATCKAALSSVQLTCPPRNIASMRVPSPQPSARARSRARVSSPTRCLE